MTKIDKDGIYDLPLETYHGDLCVGPSISSSGLKLLAPGSQATPADYWLTSPLNPDREDVEPSDQMILGSAAHHLLLGESAFADHFDVRPDEYDSYRSNAAKAWRDSVVASGKMPLIPAQLDVVKGMAYQLARHPYAKDLLRGQVEQSLIWKDRETGIWLKSRPDSIPFDSNMVADLKATQDASAKSVRYRIMDFDYHLQLALARIGMRQVLKRETTDHVLVFISTKKPHNINTKPIDLGMIQSGEVLIRKAVRKFARLLDAGDWPAWNDDDGVTMYQPQWYGEKIAEFLQDDAQGVAA